MAVLPWPNQYSQQQGTTAWNPESAFGKKQSQDWGAIAGNLQNQKLVFNNKQAELDFQYNRQNMNTPYGNINYTFNPDGTISQNTALSAGQQKVLTERTRWQQRERNPLLALYLLCLAAV